MNKIICAIFILMSIICCYSTPISEQFTQKVRLNEDSFSRVRRSTKNNDHEYHVKIAMDSGKELTLKLTKGISMDPNMKIDFIDGTTAEGYLEDVTAYQDLENGAAILLTEKMVNGRKRRSIEGIFEHENKTVNIKPDDDNDDGDHTITIVEPPNEEFHVGQESTADIDFPNEITGYVNTQGRKKRAISKSHYRVEIFLVLDNSVWEYYKGLSLTANDAETLAMIRYQYTHIMNSVDLVYRRIRHPNYMISVFVKKFLIGKTQNDCPFTGPNTAMASDPNKPTIPAVNGDKVLTELTNWISNSANTGGLDFMDLDHTLLWTKKDLYGSSYSTIGYAPVAKICSSKAISINEDRGMDSWKTAAHELGHNLGSGHDGSGSSVSCAPSSKNIMTPNLGSYEINQLKNAFVFSQCSIEAMYNTFIGNTASGFPRVCLINKVCGHEVFNTDSLMHDSDLPGEKYSVNDQCVMRFGNGAEGNSVGCKSYEKDNVCQKLVCKVGTKCLSDEPGAEDGTPCGTDMACYQGRCHLKSYVDGIKLTESQSKDCTGGTTLSRNIPSGCTNSPVNFGVNYGTHVETLNDCNVIIPMFPYLCFGTSSWGDSVCCNACKKYGYTSTNAVTLTTLDSCDPNPCQNGGVCLSYGTSGFKCECSIGFKGNTCTESYAITIATAPPCNEYTGTFKISDGNVVNCAQGKAAYSWFCNQVQTHCCNTCA